LLFALHGVDDIACLGYTDKSITSLSVPDIFMDREEILCAPRLGIAKCDLKGL
jgi:hypothetical protein